MGWKRFDLGGRSIWDVGQQVMDSYYDAVLPLMEGPSWSAAAVFVNAGGGEGEKSTIWLSPEAVELMRPSSAFVDCDGPKSEEVEQFLGAGDEFDPITVELPDDRRPQVLYPAVLEHWLAHNIGEMNNATSHDSVAEFALRT
jgi:hypothetical protein